MYKFKNLDNLADYKIKTDQASLLTLTPTDTGDSYFRIKWMFIKCF